MRINIFICIYFILFKRFSNVCSGERSLLVNVRYMILIGLLKLIFGLL